MYIGKGFAGKQFRDILKNCEESIIIDDEGCGNFKVKAKSASIWVLE